MAKGDWKCLACNGRGGFVGPRGWIKCACVRPSNATLAAQRRLNSIGTEYKTLAEREQEQQLRLDV